MMEEDAISSLSIRLKISLTVWDFVLPATPSVPAVIGVSFFVHWVRNYIKPLNWLWRTATGPRLLSIEYTWLWFSICQVYCQLIHDLLHPVNSWFDCLLSLIDELLLWNVLHICWLMYSYESIHVLLQSCLVVVWFLLFSFIHSCN